MSNSNQEDTDNDNSGDNCDADDDNDGRYDYLVSTCPVKNDRNILHRPLNVYFGL